MVAPVQHCITPRGVVASLVMIIVSDSLSIMNGVPAPETAYISVSTCGSLQQAMPTSPAPKTTPKKATYAAPSSQ